jgi:uncharacterized RDD family membrane protein YckC
MEQGQVPPQQQPPPPPPQQGWPAWQAHPPPPHWGQTPYGYQPPPYGWPAPPMPAWPEQMQRAPSVKSPPAEHTDDLPWQLAGWWIRVGAQLLDLLFVWVPASIILLIPILAAAGAEDGSGTETAWLIVAIVCVFIAIGAHLFYAPLFMKRKGKRNGQSLGKQICGIRVIRADGREMSFSDAAMRQIIYKSFGLLVASTFVPIFPWILDYLWPTWDEQHRALHDMAADTRVVAA